MRKKCFYGRGDLSAMLLALTLAIPVFGIDPLRIWHSRGVSEETVPPLLSLRFGNGFFLAGGDSGLILKSSDGLTWVQEYSGSADAIRKLEFLNGQFIALAGNNLLFSTNGQDWSRPVPAPANMTGITSGKGLYVAVDSAGGIWTSKDARSWSPQVNPTAAPQWPTAPLNGVSFTKGIFVAVGLVSTIIVSEDGVHWERSDSGAASYTGATFNDVDAGNGRFLAVGFVPFSSFGATYLFASSGNGQQWSATVTYPAVKGTLFGVRFIAGQFWAWGEGRVVVTRDGVTWNYRDPILDPGPEAFTSYSEIDYGNGRYVGVGWRYVANEKNEVRKEALTISSVDGLHWSANYNVKGIAEPNVTTWDPVDWSALDAATFAQGKFVVLGGTPFVRDPGRTPLLISTNGISWDARNFTSSESVSDLDFTDGLFTATGRAGSIFTSTNGTSWSAQPGIAGVPLNAMTFSGTTWVAVGFAGKILTSTNLLVWSSPQSPTTRNLWDVAYGGGVFVAVGDAGMVLVSADAKVWSFVVVPDAGAFNSVIYAENAFYAVGNKSTLVTSVDGVHWTKLNPFVNQDLYTIFFSQGTFLVGGSNGTLLTSTNGVDWTLQFSGTSRPIQRFAFGSDMFVAIGTPGLILQSDPIVPAAPFFIRQSTDVQAKVGGTFTIKAEAFGSSPLRFQWSKDGIMIPGATNDTFSMIGAQREAAGNYQLQVTNDFGSALSSPVRVALVQAELTPVTLSWGFGVSLQDVNLIVWGPIGFSYEVQEIIAAAPSPGWKTILDFVPAATPFTVPIPVAAGSHALFRVVVR